ncbi:MAG: heparan-alpha-glucosaminide N-acetyltransferase domain-containing protein [Smithellaceae bacterium]
MKRLDSVDVLRALALIGMVICHYPIFLSSGEGADAMLYFLTNHLLGGDFGASWFVFLVGVSQILSAKKRAADQGHNDRRVIIRGTAIFIIGLLFLLVIQGYEEMWDWDILTFIGFMTMILLYCRRVPSWTLLLLCTAVLFITPWLRSFTDIASFYGGKFISVGWISDFFPNLLFDPLKDYDGGPFFIDNVIGFFLTGQFPILPWIIYPIVGFVIGRRLMENRLPADTPFLIIIGIMFTFMGIFSAYAGSITPPFFVHKDYITPLSFYPQSFSMNIFLLGVVLTLFTILWNIFDKQPDKTVKPGLFLTYCRQISKYSLTIYITHFALFFIPLRIIQLATGKYYLRELTSTSIAFGLAVLLLILYYPVLKLWDKAGGKYSFEWFINQIISSLSGATGQTKP